MHSVFRYSQVRPRWTIVNFFRLVNCLESIITLFVYYNYIMKDMNIQILKKLKLSIFWSLKFITFFWYESFYLHYFVYRNFEFLRTFELGAKK